jgi:hypothetical protein
MGEGGSIGRATVIWYIVISKDCRKREKRKEKRENRREKRRTERKIGEQERM